VVLLAGTPARAEWLLAITEARSAAGEAGRAQAHLVDTASGTELPGAVPLGLGNVSPDLVLLTDGSEVWTGVSDEILALQPRPLSHALEPLPKDIGPAGCVVGVLPVADGPLAVLALEQDGRATAYPRGIAAVVSDHREPIPLPGEVIAGAALHHAEACVALLSQEPEGLALRVLRYIGGAAAAEFQFPIETVLPESAHVWMSAAPDLSWAALAYTLRADGVDETLLWISTAEGAQRSFPLQGALPEMATRAGALLHPAGLHVVTRTPGTPFGHLTTLSPDADGVWSKTGETVYSTLERDPALWAADHGGYAVFSSDAALERLSPSGETVWRAAFDTAPSLCFWSRGALYAATGNTLFEIHADTGAARRIVSFETGRVAAAGALPMTAYKGDDADFDGLSEGVEVESGLDPANADTDGDTILDGLDPEGRVPSARFEAPSELTLRAKGAGRELRAWWMRSVNGMPVRWSARFDEAAMPWLRLYPAEGAQSSPFYFGIDPIAARAASSSVGMLELSLFDAETGSHAAGSPALVPIRIEGQTQKPRRILWLVADDAPVNLRSKDDARGWHQALDALGGSPQYFSHAWQHAAFAGDLLDYDIVVIEAAAAARGALSQKAALDFVAQGGALLFLGGGEGPLPPYLQLWTMALGFEMVSAPPQLVKDEFSLSPQRDMTREHQLPLAAGSPISTSASLWRMQARHAFRSSRMEAVYESDTAEGERFAAGTLGLGRIALAADDSWMQSEALVTDVFHWLSEAGRDIADLDGDGLPDTLEDRDGNGTFDPGETHYLLEDTDGDGLPDGMEDRNRDGRQDPGETDPRTPDSDGDGVPDGTDAFAAPVFGAPVIQRLEPPQAPAEGMIEAALIGERLPQDARYVIGGRPATVLEWSSPSLVRLQVPDAVGDDGGLADIVIAPNDARPGAVLREGFRYSPRTRVTVTFTPLAADVEQPFTLFAVEARPPEAWRQIVATAMPGPADGPSLSLHEIKPGYTAQTWSPPEQPYFWTFHSVAPFEGEKGARVAILRADVPPAAAAALTFDTTLVLGPGGGRLAVE